MRLSLSGTSRENGFWRNSDEVPSLFSDQRNSRSPAQILSVDERYSEFKPLHIAEGFCGRISTYSISLTRLSVHDPPPFIAKFKREPKWREMLLNPWAYLKVEVVFDDETRPEAS